MGVSLQKGGNLSLTRSAPNLKRILIGLGWDARETTGDDFDLDASVFMLRENGKVSSDQDFIFYNHLKSSCGSVEHTGDNLTGEGDGDDESVKVNLEKISHSVHRIVISVTIHDASSRRQNFGMVRDAYIRIANLDNDIEIARFDLSEDYSTETAMVFGEIYRHGVEWKFKAVGQGFSGGLEPMAQSFGVNIS
ncbi:MAG TPA: TerD family protein [Arenimonas sp.]|nr:TerD family protein [Arenimonas sp.]